jgi:excisionase family DNA binding protein
VSFDPLLTKKEAAARLNTSVWAVGQLITKGQLPVVPVGSRVRIRPVDVSAYISNKASNKESVTKTTEFIGKSVAAKGEATEQDLRDATTAAVPESIKQAHKEAMIQNVMDAYNLPRDAAKDLIKADKKRRKKNQRAARQHLAEAIGPLPTGSLPSSVQAANKGWGNDPRFGGTAESAIEKMILENHARQLNAPRDAPEPDAETATYAHPFTNPYGRR